MVSSKISFFHVQVPYPIHQLIYLMQKALINIDNSTKATKSSTKLHLTKT